MYSIHAFTGSYLSVIILGCVIFLDISRHIQARHLLVRGLLLNCSILSSECLICPKLVMSGCRSLFLDWTQMQRDRRILGESIAQAKISIVAHL